MQKEAIVSDKIKKTNFIKENSLNRNSLFTKSEKLKA